MAAKKFWKYFLFVFLVSFLIINWNEVSWIFNYRTVSGLVSEFFKKSEEQKTVFLKSQDENYYDRENGLEITKIGILAPLIIFEESGEKDISSALDKGVVLFPDSVLPGQSGQTIVLGHSAPEGWPKIRYDWIFSRINELSEGDEIILYFNQRKFNYIVSGKIFLDRGEEIPDELTNSKNVLILISCWPPGKDIRRIAVAAELK